MELGDRNLVARAIVTQRATTMATMVFAHRKTERYVARGTLGRLLVTEPLRCLRQVAQHRDEHRTLIRALDEVYDATTCGIQQVNVGSCTDQCDSNVLTPSTDSQMQCCPTI